MRRVGSPVKKIKAVNVPILYIVNKLMKLFGAIHYAYLNIPVNVEWAEFGGLSY
jgi:hypothetical protein